MAEPHSRADRPRQRPRHLRALLLIGALVALIGSGLFMARSASAAPAAASSAASTAATTGPAAPGASAEPAHLTADTTPAAPAGLCNVPGVGDIGGLFGLCQSGSSGLGGLVNNICTPSTPQPELASSGIDSMITTPGGQTNANNNKTLYDYYGVAGEYWAATGLKCSDMTSLIGNNVAGMVFDMAKTLDRVTITIYQTAAGSNILSWLSNSVDTLITALGNAIYFPFLATAVVIGAIWLAWQGLVRKRATRTLEGTVWMVIACVAAIWLIGRPGDFTNVGSTVSNGVTSVLNTAFAKLPATKNSNCLPVTEKDPQSVTANFSFTSGTGMVDQNANELWSVLVCKPWLDGELGTTQYAEPGTKQAQTIVNQYGRQLLWSQAIATNEHPVTTDLVQAKQATYVGISNQLQQTNPAVYSLFQGNQWTTRLEVGFEALFASVAAGLLILLIALTLIVLKLGFLLLLVVGPFFLLIGIHPGFGRVIALRWFEMLVGVLMKQVAIAITLSVLLYCYSLIMGTTDTVLPWALKIMMIALVTAAVFIYRKPFQHLFSSVGYGVLGSEERAQVSWREGAFGFRRATATAGGAAGAVLPGLGAARAARWARRGPADGQTAAGATPQTAGATGGTSAGGTDPESMSVAAAADTHSGPGGGGGPGGAAGSGRQQWPDAGVGTGRTAPPLPLPGHGGSSTGANTPAAGWSRGSTPDGGGTTARRSAPPPARPGGPGATPPAVRQSRPPSSPASSASTRAPAPASAPSGPSAPAPARASSPSARHSAPAPSRSSSPPPSAPARPNTPVTPPPVRQSDPSTAAPRPAAPRPTGSGWPGPASRTRSGESAPGTTGETGKPAAPSLWSRTRRPR